MSSHGDLLSSQQGCPQEEASGATNLALDSWAWSVASGDGGGRGSSNRGGSEGGGAGAKAAAAPPSRREADLRIRMAAGGGAMRGWDMRR